MSAIRWSDSRIACRQCGNEWTSLFRENILVEGKTTEASIEYRKCPVCGRVEYETIFVVIESQHHPVYEGDPYAVRIPADSSAWQTDEGQETWDKLFCTYLTPRQIEATYNLKPGAVRQAVKRKYIIAKKDGHDLKVLDSVAEAYWGHRNDPDDPQ